MTSDDTGRAGGTGARLDVIAGEPTVYELSVAGRCGVELPQSDVPAAPLPAALLRADNGLPELSQLDVVRHYLHLAQRNFGVDSGFYPLGSCTMKYSPRVAEPIARCEAFADAHPLQEEATVQGNLALMFALQQWLGEIAGFPAVSLQPAAGAHGELTALLMIRACLRERGDAGRDEVLIPDSAHGTNPASSAMAGFTAVEIPSDARGNVDLAALASACGERTAALMLTNPNTLGLFEEHIREATALVHAAGGFVYGDGANMNALTGIVQPARMGLDLMHYNLHKTFSTPHGGGGPGAGPVAASADLAPYLPGPIVMRQTGAEADCERYVLEVPPRSIGRLCSFHGNFGMLVRAYVYLRLHGGAGLRANAEHAVLNANYLRVRLGEILPVPYDRPCMHEFVCQGRVAGSPVRALDISKRLMDHGFHPPTNYFPLIVPEALMIEPTESESLQTLDRFVDAVRDIVAEAGHAPEHLLDAPHRTPVRRLDEVRASRFPILTDPAAPRLDGIEAPRAEREPGEAS